MMTFNDFSAFVKASFPELSEVQEGQFRMMEPGYRDWNSKINVISRKDIDSLYDHHVLHSLAIAEYLKSRRPETYSQFTGAPGKLKVLDLGTGGGFPGIPLAILFPSVQFTLCDSVTKKTLVTREIASMLGLKNVEVVNARAESMKGSFDFVVSRAVAPLTEFFPWVKGKYSESILYLKGGEINEEISSLMTQEKMQKGSVATWQVDSWIDDEYFHEKFVIEIGRR